MLFAHYVQPLTAWITDHPNYALVITFAVAFAESLVIIGTLIPGSVTMTALGILVGSGVMRIDLTCLAAALGAVSGDAASYAIGYAYSDRLTQLWPFSRYPKWLNSGKDYFHRHGGKSVLIGRFVGPLRSIIPVIAGMMRMNRWHFFMANVVSGIGWAILYLLPGVLIGEASIQMSPENASKLFLGLLIGVVGLWAASVGVRWVLQRIKRRKGS